MTVQPAPVPGPAPGRRPRRIGRYELLARIGEGGMGVVHLARAEDGRRVALKVLRPHIVGDAEARERLAREVSSLRLVSSPRVAEVIDADPHGPTPFVVTRYVPGLSLYHHLAEEGVLAGRDLLHLADGLAQALEAVHAVGVLHRDVKPTNVLMEGRSPVLIDFGLARLADDPRLTQTGFLLGTPGYLAPEILYGDDPTPAADVHAWAATVVFAATGRPPYGQGPTLAVMDRVRRGQHDLRDVPASLAPLLADCLAPEPHERPTLAMMRETLRGPVERAAAAARPVPERELWTMPVHPAVSPGGTSEETDRTGIAPLHAPLQPAPVARAEAPPTSASTPVSPPARAQVPARVPITTPAAVPTRVLPPDPAAGPRPVAQVPQEPSGLQRTLQLAGLALLAAALVAFAPYAGAAVVALVVLVLRTTSVTRQRHARRRMVRGRARWYDVPVTTLGLPAYLLVALGGTVVVIALAAVSAAAMLSLGYLLGRPIQVSLMLAGAGFVPALWWGPCAGRVRESARTFVRRTARTEFGGWFVAISAALGAAVLLGLLASQGPTWSPALTAPWHALR